MSGVTVTLPIEDYERLKRGFERYEFVRRLNVQQFSEMLFERSLKDDIPFDELVDIEMASRKKSKKLPRGSYVSEHKTEW